MLWGYKVMEMTDAFVDRALVAGYNVVCSRPVRDVPLCLASRDFY